MTSPLYVGLVHYPIYDKNFNVIATAITNYDLHDISRSAKTYGVKKYFIIHHIPGQLDMVHKIMDFGKARLAATITATAHRLSISSTSARPSKRLSKQSPPQKGRNLTSSRRMRGPMPIPFPTRICGTSGKKTIRRSSCSLARAMA